MELSRPVDELPQSLFPPVDSERPPYSYKELIIKAFELVKSKPLELRDIYFLISGIFPYYKPGGAWQSAVRHVLVSDPVFLTDPRTNLWRIIPDFESQNLPIMPQFKPNAFNFNNHFPVSTSSLVIRNSVSPTISSTDTSFYSVSEDNRIFPFIQNSSVRTVSSYTTSQPRMSSFETSNRWIDGYSGKSLQGVTSWPSTTNYSPNFSESLLSQQTLSGETNSCCVANEHIPGHLRPVKPSVIRSFVGSNYNALHAFSPLPSYPINANFNTFLGRSFDDRHLVKTSAFSNKQIEGALNFFRAENNLSECKSSDSRNEEAYLNTWRNFRSQKDFSSLPPSNSELFPNPQNSYSTVYPDGFCPNGYFDTPKISHLNQISNQLVSVNIYAPQCSHQNPNYSGFDSSTMSSDCLSNRNRLSGSKVTDASFMNNGVSNIYGVSPTNTVNSLYPNFPNNAQRYTNAHCADNVCNTNVNIESPTLNDVIGSFSTLSSSINTTHNTLESTPVENARKEMNWETSLINININLSALQNANVVNVSRSKDKPVYDMHLPSCGTETLPDVPPNINAVPNITNQEVDIDYTSLCSSVADECSETGTNVLNSTAETTLDVNGPITGSVVSNSSCDSSCSTFAEKDSGEPYIETDIPAIASTKSEENVSIAKITSCMASSCNNNSVDDSLNLTEETLIVNNNCLSRPLTSKDYGEFASVSCHEPIESNVENSVECSETQSRSKTEICFSTVSLLTPETCLSLEQSEPTDPNGFSTTKDYSSALSTCDTSKNANNETKLPLNDEESSRDLEPILSPDSVKLKNKVKQCYIVLERIKFPVTNLISNSGTGKVNVDNNLANISPTNNQAECEDFSNMAILPGQNLSVGEGLGSRLNNQAPTKLTHVAAGRRTLPPEVNGHAKPSYNYCRLITQALATIPERKATASQICDMIAKKHLYYAHLTGYNWRGSIHHALRTRKKFFTVVGADSHEIVWSFNPKFEQFMLDKWVPKIVQKKSMSSTIHYIPWLPKSQQRVISSEHSMTNVNTVPSTADSCPSPVIEFSGTLVDMSIAAGSGISSIDCSNSNANPNTSEGVDRDPLGPETGSDLVIQSVSSVADDFRPWEPEVSVNEDIPSQQSQQPENVLAIPLPGLASEEPQGKKMPSTTFQTVNPLNKDFSLDNLNVKHTILKEEITYRVKFNQEHQSVEKFRLHCTVCDDHLGTSGAVCRRRVRLHSVLGVLVCSKCYEATCAPVAGACLWCAKPCAMQRLVRCSDCPNVFCLNCLERNFGQSWCAMLVSRGDWKCFRCDTKQIWPHRAIAYFLFRHYREIKRNKEELSKHKEVVTPRELRFFIQDLSTCCKPFTGTSKTKPVAIAPMPSADAPVASVIPPSTFVPPVVPNPALVSTSTASVSGQPPLFVIGEQSPNYIYVQTPSSVPSVTLNTGTQYIHNVFPDKNYVVLDKTGPVSAVNTSTLANTFMYSQPVSTTPSFPVRITTRPTNTNPSLPTDKPPPYSSYNSPPPPYSAVEISPPREILDSSVTEPALNTFSRTNFGQTASKVVENYSHNIIVTPTSEVITSNEPGEPIIIPDANPPEEVNFREEKVVALPILSARERIERKPMPKSKKQSLLRAVLMNESIESMKRHLQRQPEPNIPTSSNKTPETIIASRICHEGNQNMEEPILKSIIETATERLLSLQRNQTISSNSSPNIDETSPATNANLSPEMCIDLCEGEDTSNKAEYKVTESLVNFPKIKIKTLRELQDPEVFKDDHNSQETIYSHENEKGIDKGSNDTNENFGVENQDRNKENVTEEAKINITDLKQGIIEASRTLINTQKQFKALAKIISCNLMYSPDKAVELVTKFHEILKTCHEELDQIDCNVKSQFEYLIPNSSINLVIPSASTVESKKEKKKRGKSKSYCSEQEYIEENQTDSLISNTGIETKMTDVQSSIKRKRDLLDFNPLGKKIILGSPDVTEEDLKRIQDNKTPSYNQVYMEELRRRQYLAKKGAWKKKNIWLSTRRKKRKYTKNFAKHDGPLMYNEDGALIKKRRGRPCKKRRRNSDSDDDDTTYKPTNFYLSVRPARRRSSELSRPLRLSARCHPSSVAHVAQLMSDEQRGVIHQIRPCFVMLERLDPKMVEILERSAPSQPSLRLNLSLSDSDELELR